MLASFTIMVKVLEQLLPNNASMILIALLEHGWRVGKMQTLYSTDLGPIVLPLVYFGLTPPFIWLLHACYGY